MGYVTDMIPFEPSPFFFYAVKWPRRGDTHVNSIEYTRDIDSYSEPLVYHPISCSFFHDLARKDFWTSFVPVYGETGLALHVSQFAAASFPTVSAAGRKGRTMRSPPPHPAALSVDAKSIDSVVAHGIQTARIERQRRTIATLQATRSALADWRASYLNKKDNPDLNDQQQAKHDMVIEGSSSPGPGNPSHLSLPNPPTLTPAESPSVRAPATSASTPPPISVDDMSGSDSDFSYEGGDPNAPPARLEYIHRSLCNLRLVLNLDTMVLRVPKHQFLEYLNRELMRMKRVVVEEEEFTQYLRHMALERKMCYE